MEIKKSIQEEANENTKKTKKINSLSDNETLSLKEELEKVTAEKNRLIIEYALEREVKNAGGIYSEPIKALINFDSVRVENNKAVGISEEISRIKKEFPLLFHAENIPYVVQHTAGENYDSLAAVREAMGI